VKIDQAYAVLLSYCPHFLHVSVVVAQDCETGEGPAWFGYYHRGYPQVLVRRDFGAVGSCRKCEETDFVNGLLPTTELLELWLDRHLEDWSSRKFILHRSMTESCRRESVKGMMESIMAEVAVVSIP
jgi:hypothetical protein